MHIAYQTECKPSEQADFPASFDMSKGFVKKNCKPDRLPIDRSPVLINAYIMASVYWYLFILHM